MHCFIYPSTYKRKKRKNNAPVPISLQLKNIKINKQWTILTPRLLNLALHEHTSLSTIQNQMLEEKKADEI
jgi:hypothetical protein